MLKVGRFDPQADEELVAEYVEWLRDKRSVDDLEKGWPWCPRCQSAHRKPHAVPPYEKWAAIEVLRRDVNGAGKKVR